MCVVLGPEICGNLSQELQEADEGGSPIPTLQLRKLRLKEGMSFPRLHMLPSTPHWLTGNFHGLLTPGAPWPGRQGWGSVGGGGRWHHPNLPPQGQAEDRE